MSQQSQDATHQTINNMFLNPLVSAELNKLVSSATTPPPNFVYVGVEGDDNSGIGSQLEPFLTIGKAQSTITDASITDLGGIRKNPSKSYTIVIGPGTFVESNTWAPLPYINYLGAGRNFTTVRRSNNSAITMNYGDNYGFTQSFNKMTMNSFSIIRTAGFTNTSFVIALGGNGFVNTGFTFYDFASSNCTFQGSGYDNGTNGSTGKLDVMADSTNFRDCNLTGTCNWKAIQLVGFASQFPITTINFTGVDGSYATSGGYVNNQIACSFTRVDLTDYASITLKASTATSARLLNRVSDVNVTQNFGQLPSINVEVGSMVAAFSFLGGAIGDQVVYQSKLSNIKLSPGVANVVGGTPYINTTNAQRIISQGGASVDITLQGGLEQTIMDYAGDSGTNVITIRTPRFWKFSANLGGGTSITRSSNGGSWSCVPTTIGTSSAVIQVSDIQTVADSSGSLNNTYFFIYALSGIQLPVLYVPWFNVNNAGVAPTGLPVGANLVQVNIATNATAVQVATALVAAMGIDLNGFGPNHLMATAIVSGNDLHSTNRVAGAATHVVDGAVPTGFTFSTPTAGVDPISGTFTVSP